MESTVSASSLRIAFSSSDWLTVEATAFVQPDLRCGVQFDFGLLVLGDVLENDHGAGHFVGCDTGLAI